MTVRAVLGPSLLIGLIVGGLARTPSPQAAAQGQPAPPLPHFMLDLRSAREATAELPQTAATDWLSTVNDFRAAALLPPVVEDPSLTGCVEHSIYCVKNNVLVHGEDPNLPFFTPEGNTAGLSSNVMASSTVATTDQRAVDLWMQGPFHAIGIIDPRLARSNFGSYREVKAGLQMAATLDVLRGRNPAGSVTVPFPVIWPANGQFMPARCGHAGAPNTACYGGGESPDPLTSCSGYTVPTGHPVYLQLGTGSVTPNVTASSFTQNGVPLEHCVYDETTYVNPDPGTQSLGRNVLGARDAIVLIPRAPLNNGQSYTASITVNGTAHTWTFSVGDAPPPPGPTMVLDKTSLHFAAVTNGVTFLSQTSPQIVRLTQSGLPGTVSWTATPNQPWLTVSPSSGTGPADLVIGVTAAGGVPVGGSVGGSISLAFAGAGNTAGPIDVVLTTFVVGTSAGPFGVVDTPLDHTTGVSGAVPFTGWALDRIEVDSLTICRNAVAWESAPVDPKCGGAAQIFIGDAVFVDGARPDVQAGFPTYPRNSRAGWGFMVLTNMLPDVARGLPTGGNGMFVFSIYARGREGQVALLGTRTMTCDNEHATKPFGAIDTPGQGAVVSGSEYVNFGWVLTPNPKFIPTDGSTITVYVDGLPVGTVSYNHFRPDIAGFFPGLANSDGAIGFRIIDTTALANGVHTIAWGVSDSAGAADGIGSRYFTVSNGAGAASAAASSIPASGGGLPASMWLPPSGGSSANSERSPEGEGHAIASALAAAPRDRSAILGRRGWDTNAPLGEYPVDGAGRVVVRGEELDRIELHLTGTGRHEYSGYLRVGRELSPLPIGSSLNTGTGRFTWQPGVGFVGTYDLVFVRASGGRAVARQEVRIILAPKGSGPRRPQVVIDTPQPQQDAGQPFLLAGWAADLRAETGTGIETLHVWAYPLTGEPPIFLGVADQGGHRPDVADLHGAQFREAGYGLVVQGLVPGNYDIAVFAWSTVSGGFVPAQVVRVTVR